MLRFNHIFNKFNIFKFKIPIFIPIWNKLNNLLFRFVLMNNVDWPASQ